MINITTCDREITGSRPCASRGAVVPYSSRINNSSTIMNLRWSIWRHSTVKHPPEGVIYCYFCWSWINVLLFLCCQMPAGFLWSPGVSRPAFTRTLMKSAAGLLQMTFMDAVIDASTVAQQTVHGGGSVVEMGLNVSLSS